MYQLSKTFCLITALCFSIPLCGCTEKEMGKAKNTVRTSGRFAYMMQETTITVPIQTTVKEQETTMATTAKAVTTTTVTSTSVPIVTTAVTVPVLMQTTSAVKETEAVTELRTETITEQETEQESTEELSETAFSDDEQQEETEPEIRNFEYNDEYYYFPSTEIYPNGYVLSVKDYILLCNCVAHEAGNQPLYEMGKVVETVMNRVYDSEFPDSIYGVITQPNQFTGSYKYADLDGYSYEVNTLCCEAVENYFCFPENYQHGYLYFHGDNYANYFS